MGKLVRLRPEHRDAAYAYMAAEPVENVVAISRLLESDLAAPRQDAWDIVAWMDGERIGGVMTRTGSSTLYATDPEAWEPLALFAAARLPLAPQITARKDMMDALWPTLRHYPFPVRFDRLQIVYSVTPEALRPASEQTTMHFARPEQRDVVARLFSAMIEEEIQDAPYVTNHAAFMDHVDALIAHERIALLIEDGEIRFLSVLSALGPATGEIGGSYTPPVLRRQGHAGRGLSALCRLAFERTDRIVSVVNEENEASARVKRRRGFTDTGLRLRTVAWNIPLAPL